MGIVALAPLFWRHKPVYVYYQDGYIEKTIVEGNRNRTFIKIGSMYVGQRVLVRLILGK